jgi:hypothetical protein
LQQANPQYNDEGKSKNVRHKIPDRRGRYTLYIDTTQGSQKFVVIFYFDFIKTKYAWIVSTK